MFRFVEFKYNLGNGAVVLTSVHPITIGTRHKIVAKRYQKDGLLQFEDHEPVRSVSMGSLRSLDLNDNAYIGYVPIVHQKYNIKFIILVHIIRRANSQTPKDHHKNNSILIYFPQDIRKHRCEIGIDRVRAQCENRTLLCKLVGIRRRRFGDQLRRSDGMSKELFEWHVRLYR